MEGADDVEGPAENVVGRGPLFQGHADFVIDLRFAAETADLIVIGSGQGGVPLAVDFAKAGKTVVLFERDALGGSCINYGCTPSKAFLAAAHAAGRGHP